MVVAIEVAADEAELAADELFRLGASAVSESVGLSGGAVLVADLPPVAIESITRPFTVVDPQASWTDGWRDHARAWEAGPFVVRPPWVPRPVDVTARFDMVIDPGTAFGSASHASTRQCLGLLGDLAPTGSDVVDVGCGSGVLSVAAALLGAAHVVAVDVDPAAVSATAANARANGVGDRIDVSATSARDLAPGRADVVLANLLVPILEDLGPTLVGLVRPGGVIVAAGFLTEQRERVAAALAPARIEVTLESAPWAAVVARLPRGVE